MWTCPDTFLLVEKLTLISANNQSDLKLIPQRKIFAMYVIFKYAYLI